jgi:arsenate reductase-like glutaredoxin family protein
LQAEGAEFINMSKDNIKGDHMNYKSLSDGLRNVLSTRRITYKEIATELDMSESGVKKMLTGEDISYNKLNAILNMLDLKLEELMAVSPKAYAKLTANQESYFEKYPKHFNFFIQLHHFNMKSELVKKANSKLSKQQIKTFLEDLSSIKVIHLAEGSIYSLLSDGFNASEKFNKKFRSHYKVLFAKRSAIENDKWNSWMFEGIGTFNLSHKSALELRNGMKLLLDEFSKRSDREKKIYDSKDLISTGTCFLNIPLKIQELFPVI